MPPAQSSSRRGSPLTAWVVILVLALAIGGGIFYYLRSGKTQTEEIAKVEPVQPQKEELATEKVGEPGKVIDLEQVQKAGPQAAEMDQRKADLGVKESLDAVVEAHETVKIGGAMVAMKDIIAEIETVRKGPAQGSEGAGGAAAGAAAGRAAGSASASPGGSTVVSAVGTAYKRSAKYGLHLVRKGDNLWVVHFAFLKEYFAKHGIQLSPRADRPDQAGRSSGVARILKFAEGMVHIYNVKTGKLSDNLDLIRPNEKIVVFNITELNTILSQLDEKKIKKIRLEGQNLYIED